MVASLGLVALLSGVALLLAVQGAIHQEDGYTRALRWTGGIVLALGVLRFFTLI